MNTRRVLARTFLLASLAVVAVACPPTGPGGTGGGTLPAPVDNSAGSYFDPTNLPIGDYHLTATTPQKGWILRCSTNVQSAGAFADGPWIRSNGTFDLTTKLQVQGSVSWPAANVSITIDATHRIITGNTLPVGSTTGVFPIAASDPAYQYDRNPNSISAQTTSITLPLDPTVAASPRCLTGGPIAYATNGVPIFDGFDAGGRDAVAHEIQDSCDGHPQQQGMYHYHSSSDCIPGNSNPTSTLIGYALDGFGLYNRFDAAGNELSNDDLDECHGTTSPVLWNGSVQNVYHYVATEAFPYTLGCFKGA
jgi:hypothetical protein